MTITRSGLHAEISLLDEQIDALNKDKSNCFKAYRQQMEAEKRTGGDIAAEIKACKKAFKLKRALTKNRVAVEQQDALVDEILSEIEVGTRRATRATRERTSLDAGGNVNTFPSKASRPGKGTLNPQPCEEASPVEIPTHASVSGVEGAADPPAPSSNSESRGGVEEVAHTPSPARATELERNWLANRPAVESAAGVAPGPRDTEIGEGPTATLRNTLSAPLVAAAGDRGDGGTAATLASLPRSLRAYDPNDGEGIPDFLNRVLS